MTHRISRTARRMALAIAIAAPVHAIGAQQACKPATAWADTAITMFLNDLYEVTFRQSRDITATSVTQLQPLTDLNDAALCARMDSSMRRLPAHYYRSDSTIIGTYVSADPDPGIMSIDESPLVLVFDAAGRLIYFRGKLGAPTPPSAPSDLRATASVSGLVRIQWSNRGTPPSSYRLQRADSLLSDFTDIGAALPASATHAIDSTAVTGVLYRYRLRAIGATEWREFSSVVMHRAVAASPRRPAPCATSAPTAPRH